MDRSRADKYILADLSPQAVGRATVPAFGDRVAPASKISRRSVAIPSSKASELPSFARRPPFDLRGVGG